MKLNKLVIHNLASIEDAAIAFDEKPLADEPIFLIDGPTGAGKSTLLDAICLALYGQVPRLHGAAEKSVSYTERYNAARGKSPDHREEKERTVALDDPRQLMRRGSTECHVTLSFDVDGHGYEATWSTSRANDRADGNMGKVKWTLTDSEGETTDKAAGMAIEALVGLTFDQFCRTVMLAQGEFTKFIQSKTEDKSAILQKITGTEIYEKIGAKIGVKHAAMENAIKLLRQKQGDIPLLSAEAEAARRQALASLQAEAEQLRQALNTLNAQCDWLKSHDNLRQQRQAAQQAVEAAQATLATDMYRRERQDIEDYAATEAPRIWLDTRQKSEATLTRLLTQEQQLARSFATLDAARAAMERRSTDLAGTLSRIAADQQALAPHTAMLEAAQRLTTQMEQLRHAEEANRMEHTAIEHERNNAATYEKAVRTADLAKQEADKATAAKQQEVEAKNKEYENLHPADNAEKTRQLNHHQQLLTQYDALATSLQAAQQQRSQIQAKAAALHIKEKEYTDAAPTLQTAMAESKRRYNHDNDLYAAFKEALNKDFKLVRKQLHKGDACPLCGSTVTSEAVPDPDFDAVVLPKLQAMKQSNADWVAAQAAVETNQNLIAETRKQLADLLLQEKENDISCHTLMERMAKGWRTFWPLEALPAGEEPLPFQQRIAQEQHDMDTQQQTLEEAQRLIIATAAELTRLNKEKDRLAALQTQRTAAMEQQTGAKRTYEKALAQRTAALATATANALELHRQIASQISYPDWEQAWQQEASQTVKRLKSDAAHYQELKDRWQQTTQEKAMTDNTLQNIQGARSKIADSRPAWTQLPPAPPAATTATALQSGWQQLQSNYDKWSQEMARCREDIAEAQDKLTAYCNAHSHISETRIVELAQMQATEMNRIAASHKAAEEQLTTEKGKQEKIEEQWQTHCTAKPPMDDGTTAAQLQAKIEAGKEQQDTKQRDIGSTQRDLETNDKNRQALATVLQEIAQAEQDKQRWDILYKYFGDNDGKKFRNVAQSFILKHLLGKANIYLSHFTDRYALTCEPGSLVILVQDRLTNQPPQYVKVLSGGESFMVSLSLALALAQLNTHSTGVDILFIDEGFGTLDETSLNSMMNTLARLHEMGGRKVGIISHVEELARLIPTQIRVMPVNPSKSEVQVVTI